MREAARITSLAYIYTKWSRLTKARFLNNWNLTEQLWTIQNRNMFRIRAYTVFRFSWYLFVGNWGVGVDRNPLVQPCQRVLTCKALLQSSPSLHNCRIPETEQQNWVEYGTKLNRGQSYKKCFIFYLTIFPVAGILGFRPPGVAASYLYKGLVATALKR